MWSEGGTFCRTEAGFGEDLLDVPDWSGTLGRGFELGEFTTTSGGRLLAARGSRRSAHPIGAGHPLLVAVSADRLDPVHEDLEARAPACLRSRLVIFAGVAGRQLRGARGLAPGAPSGVACAAFSWGGGGA